MHHRCHITLTFAYTTPSQFITYLHHSGSTGKGISRRFPVLQRMTDRTGGSPGVLPSFLVPLLLLLLHRSSHKESLRLYPNEILSSRLFLPGRKHERIVCEKVPV